MSVDSFEASVKKSDALKEDLFEHPTKYIMLTGDRPTGRLHLGHYFGTIKERVNLQNKGVPTRVVIARLSGYYRPRYHRAYPGQRL